jgi:hypothetical protein
MLSVLYRIPFLPHFSLNDHVRGGLFFEPNSFRRPTALWLPHCAVSLGDGSNAKISGRTSPATGTLHFWHRSFAQTFAQIFARTFQERAPVSVSDVQVLRLGATFRPFAAVQEMCLSPNALRQLEILRNSADGTEKGSLLWLMDQTSTPFGGRLLRHWVGHWSTLFELYVLS